MHNIARHQRELLEPRSTCTDQPQSSVIDTVPRERYMGYTYMYYGV